MNFGHLIITLAQQNTLIVIVGPTAVGKTRVAIQIARHFQTEIVSADSRQIYRELTIGTAKPSEEELAMVQHHFVNSHSIHDRYDAAQYGRDALVLIDQLFQRYPVVVLCGGSGLYIKAVCEGFDDIPDVPGKVRDEINYNYQNWGLTWLQEQVQKLDPEYFAAVDQQNPHRLVRALEVVLHTGKSIRSFQKGEKTGRNFSMIKIGLDLPRAILYARIDARMDQMIADGLFAEASALRGMKSHQALQTVGYQEIFDFLDGTYDYEEAVRLLKRNSRRYAKRQLTWFKRDHDVAWFAPGQIDEMIAYIQKLFTQASPI